MTPEAFAAKVSETIGKLDGNYRLVARGMFGDANYQAQVHFGRHHVHGREYILIVADTDPSSDAFSSQNFRPGEVDVPDAGVRFEETNLPSFRDLGAITVPYPS